MRAVVVGIVALALLFSVANAVVRLDAASFKSTTANNNVFVKWFAPWCGHCKKLAPEYEKVSEAFATNRRVIIAEVDCDAEADLCRQYDIKGYPTLKFFKAGEQTPIDYEGGRTAEDIIQFIEGNGIRAKKSSHVVPVTSHSFDKIVMDDKKDVLVKFYAPWCGHCKELAPIYQSVSKAFSAEDVILAEVDCDANSELCSKYKVEGYPTLKWFPKNDKTGIDYTKGRSVPELVEFLNKELGTFRSTDGSLSGGAGRIQLFDELARKFMQATDKQAVLEEAKPHAENPAIEKDAKQYIKIMELVISKGTSYIATEKERLTRMMSTGSLAQTKIDDFTKRINVLDQFVAPL